MILETHDLTKNYEQGEQVVQALRGVSVSIKRGEFVTVIGPSGSGKSTFLHLIGGLDRPSSGSVRLTGMPIESFSDKQLSAFRRQKLGFIFQFFHLLPTLSAAENVALPMLLDGRNAKEALSKAIELLELMGLGHRASHRSQQLSGGEMQRVAIARALVTDPVLVLADEPTGNLDSVSGTKMLELLQRLVDDRQQTLVMVTHDHTAASFGHRTIAMRDGLVETEGHINDVLQTVRARERLGESQ